MFTASTLATLALAGAAAASPITDSVTPNYPPKQTSVGFKLVVNVTDPSRDLSPSIQNTFLTSIHVGAGLNLVGQSSDQSVSRTFYVNGTTEEVFYNQAHVISDAGYIIEGLALQGSQNGNSAGTYATLNGGSGQKSLGLTRFPNPYVYLTPSTYYACKEAVQYYGGKEFVVIKNAPVAWDSTVDATVPEGCAPVNLIPQCAELAPLPEGSSIKHDFAATSECYKDVSALNWPEYGP